MPNPLLEHRQTKGEDPNQVISLLALVGSFFSMVAPPSFSLSLLNVPGGSVNPSQSLSHFSPLSLEQPQLQGVEKQAEVNLTGRWTQR